MTPDEVHAMGQRELEQLHAEMDTILKGIGFTTGTVGQRMQAFAKDKRYQFAEGDKGRQEILAFIQERLTWVRISPASPLRTPRTSCRSTVDPRR